jgi:cation transporter-like permease
LEEETMELKEVVQTAVSGVAGESDVVKAAVGSAAVAAAVPAPPESSVSLLWTILVAGLVVAVLGSLVGVIVVVADGKDTTDPNVIVTIFTTTLAGLIGLFVKSPTA